VSALLLRLCDAQAASGDLEASIATAHRLIALDPLQEHVHRRLMQAYLRLKRFDAALRQFDTLKAVLDQELGVSPEPPTMELVRQIRQERSGRARLGEPDPSSRPPQGSHSAPGRPSIAVLPFRGLFPAPDSAILGEGLTDEITIELAREAGLMVVSRASSSRFDADADSPRAVGDALGVRFLLTGSVRMAGNRLRLTAHLSESGSGREVWAERYDREIDDLFAMQTEIARTVAATVVGRINDTEARSTETRSSRSLDAVAHLLQGERRHDEHTESGMTAAVEHFRQAVELTPNLARARGLLALGSIGLRWYFRIGEPVDDIVPLGKRAVALDWRDAKGHCALGMTHLVRRDFDRAEYHLETGLQMNPNDDRLLIEHGRFLMYSGRPEEGLMRVREAMRLNPFHPNWYWNISGRCLHTAGRFAEALEAFQRIPAPPFYVHAYMAACHRALGHAEAAAAEDAALRASRPDLNLEQFRRSFPYKDEATGRHFFDSMFG
jgi:adenylate cyclase